MSATSNPLARGGPDYASRARQIKMWTRELLQIGTDVVVSVNEMACSLPGCPPKETVVLVMMPQEPPRQISLHMPLRNVTRQDLADAFEAFPRAEEPGKI